MFIALYLLRSLMLSSFSFLSDQEPQEEESEEPFVAPPGLVIPSDVELVSWL